MPKWIPWFNKDPSGYLYYLLLNTSDGPMYKLGITKKESIRGRFRDQLKEDPEFINEVFAFKWFSDVEKREKILHAYFNKHRAYRWQKRHRPLYSCGQSELYRTDVLGLHEALYLSKTVEERIPIYKEGVPRKPTSGNTFFEGLFLWLIVVIAAASVVGLILAIPLGIYLIYACIVPDAGETFPQPIGWRTAQKTVPGVERPKHPDHIQALIEKMLPDQTSQTKNSGIE